MEMKSMASARSVNSGRRCSIVPSGLPTDRSVFLNGRRLRSSRARVKEDNSPRMSLLSESKRALPPPRLEGKEKLVGPDPSVCKVKGVMFGGRKQFLRDALGEAGMAELLTGLTPRTAQYAKTPLASSWCEFESLIELDRAIYERLKSTHPNVLALIGPA